MIKTEAIARLRRLLAAAEQLPEDVRILSSTGDLDELHVITDDSEAGAALFVNHQVSHDSPLRQHQFAEFAGIRLTRIVPKDGFFGEAQA